MTRVRLYCIFACLMTPLFCSGQTKNIPANEYASQTDAYLEKIARQQLAERQAQVAAIHDAKGVHSRQEYIQRTLLHEIGGLPNVRTPLHAEITGTVDHQDYVLQKLVYQSLPGFYVTADLFVPTHGAKPYPAVLGVAGHSPQGKAGYQTIWVSLAKRGFVVLAIDPVGQGERIEHLDPTTHKPQLQIGGTPEHMADGLPALLTGTNIARYFIWDGMRGIDYLQSRDDVDKTRIGVAGNSGGGTQSAYISTLDKRVAASVISCYLSNWNAMWEDPGPQDSEQVFNRFLADHLDYADFLTNIAPRPVEMEVATQDFFPIQGAHDTFAEAKHMFDLVGESDHIALFEAGDSHGWSQPRRLAAYAWLQHWLENGAAPSDEENVTPDKLTDLLATRTGQVLTTYPDAKTVQSINMALAEKLRAKPFRGSRVQLATLVRSRLALPAEVSAAKAESRGTFTQGKLTGDKLDLHTEPGITVPALLFVPSGAAKRRPAVVYVNPAGMAGDASANGPIQRLVDEGNVVLAVDPRGWGATTPPNLMISGYRSDYQLAMHAILVGKSVPGMQTLDVLSATQYLRTRPEVDRANVWLRGIGFGCNVDLFAATVDPRIRAVTCDAQPTSYVAITQLPLSRISPEVIVPGVLLDFDIPDITRILGSRFRVNP